MTDDRPLTEEQRRRSAEMIELARRDLAAIRDQPTLPDTSPGKFGDPRPSAPPSGPASAAAPVAARPMDPDRTRDLIAGGLLGVHAGDSLGATLEFRPWAEIRRQYPDGLREIVGGGTFGWPAGAATDDTDLTRAVLRGYLTAPGSGAGDVVRRWPTRCSTGTRAAGPAGRPAPAPGTSAGPPPSGWTATGGPATPAAAAPDRSRPATGR